MDSPTRESMPGYRWITILAGIVLMVLFCGLVLLVGLSGILPGFKIPTPTLATAAATPTVVVVTTPHILVHPPGDATVVVSDSFSSGLGEWALRYPNGKIQEINGQLVLQSNTQGQHALAIDQRFLTPGTKYYVQADFRTDLLPEQGYGLIFGANDSVGTFYLLDISPSASAIRLWLYTQGTWKNLVDKVPIHMKDHSYPTTLSAYFDNGQIELYVDGKLASTYSDKEPLRSTGIGVYVAGPGYRLFMTNLFGYSLQ